MKRFFKIFFYAILISLLLLQLYPKPAKNISAGINSNDITVVHYVPPDVSTVLKASCYDCHSNNTVYPWYSHLQPVASSLGDHIAEGKRELNFSEFGSYNIGRQYRKLEEMNEQVKDGEMPLSSYTFIHGYAKLSESQKLLIATWVTILRDSIASGYPADSLVRRKN